MRRAVSRLLPLAVLALALAACGGGGNGSDESANPLLDAAEATAAAGTSTTNTTATVTYPGAALRLQGEGGYNHGTNEGWQHLMLRLPAGTAVLDEVFVTSSLWMKSDALFGADLPPGKEWLKYDTNKAGVDSGFNFKALMGQTPADVLKQLQRAKPPFTEVGIEDIDGEETTHYRAAIDTTKIPAADNLQKLTKSVYKPIDVWVDEDGRVRQVRFDYTALVNPAETVRARCAADDEARRLRRDGRCREARAERRRRRDGAGGLGLMRLPLKIWRVDPGTGERALREYEVDAPEWATLLDVLDIVKDRHDGTLAFRKSCRMMICGACAMRVDGAAVLACKTRMLDLAGAGRVPVVSAMGNLPVVKDLVVDMGPFWAKYRAVDPYLSPGYDEPGEREHVILQERTNVIRKESLCINCGACVSECNSMESDPDFLGPQALAKAMRFVGDPRDGAKVDRLEAVNGKNGIWQCTRCYFCNERCPKGVDPRDAIAKLGAESIKEGITRDMGAKHAKWFARSARTTGWLREAELVPRTQGLVHSIRETRFALKLARGGKVPLPPPAHVAKDVKQARQLYDLVREQGRDGFAGIVQGERALDRIALGKGDGRDPYGDGSFPRPAEIAPEASR